MNGEPDFGELEMLPPPLEWAVNAVLAPALPEDAIGRVVAQAKRLAATPATPRTSVERSPRGGWRISRAGGRGLAAAAALVAVAAGIALLVDRPTSRAFALVIEKVKAADSVRFAMTTRMGRQRAINGKMYLEGNRLRLEQWDGAVIEVVDLATRQALYLDPGRKIAQKAEVEADVDAVFANPIDQLRHAKSSDAEPIGQEIINHRRANVYRLRKANLLGTTGSELLVWVDAQSDLPVRIVIRDDNPQSEMELRFDDFVWNEPLDAGLFSLDAPQGFKPGVIVRMPNRDERAKPGGTEPAAAPAFVDGVLHDRAAGQILWGPQSATLTAMMRDPEYVPSLEVGAHELRQWDLASGQLRWSESVAGADSVAASPDGHFLATIIGREVQLRDAATGKILRKWITDQPLGPLAFSPDGKTLAAGITEWGPYGGGGGKESGGAEFWDVERGSLLRSITDDHVTSFVKYSVDGKRLVTTSNQGPIKLWDTATGELTRIFPGRFRADFSPDGETIAGIAAAEPDEKKIGRVDLFRMTDGSAVRRLASEAGKTGSSLLSVEFSPDGRSLVAADWNGTVTIWDVATGGRQRSITDHGGGVLSAVFSPDGSWLATGSEDKTLRLWKLTGE